MKEIPYLDYFKEEYLFDEWKGQSGLIHNLFIWKYFVTGSELPDWNAYTIESIKIPKWPPLIKSIWQHSKIGSESAIRIEMFECASRLKAHNYLLFLLSTFEHTLTKYEEESSVGDVSFTNEGETTFLFARANMCYKFVNADRKVVRVCDYAKQFDQDLIKTEDFREEKVKPEIVTFNVKNRFSFQEPTKLDLEAQDPLNRRIWFKFVAPLGEIQLKKGQLVYIPTNNKTGHRITVLALNENRGLARRELNLEET